MSNCVSQSEWPWQAAVSYGRSGGIIPVTSVAAEARRRRWFSQAS
jgi:hypothetical protein